LSSVSNQGRRALPVGSKLSRDGVLELRSPESSPPVAPRAPETPQLVQAFVSRHRSFFVLAAVLVAQLALLAIQITRARDLPPAKAWAVTALVPFERSLRGLADITGGSWEAFRNLAHAEDQNQALSARLTADETQIRELSAKAGENERLRLILDFKARAPFATVAAEVIGASPGENSNTVLIDKGADAGFTADLPVVTPDGVAGKIIAVYPQSAQVLLITDPSSGAGSLLRNNRVQGVLKGTGRGLCQLDYVMNEDAVSPGDRVMTSGLDQIFPKGLPLGTVVKVGEGNIYKEIVVKPAVALDRLEEVLVVTSKPAPPEEAKSPAH
jgi:rod shape-determining protein MreC